MSALAGIALALALTGTAVAVSYRTGVYKQAGQSGFKRPGIRIDIRSGSFNLERILAHETCTADGHPTVHDLSGFQQDPHTTLTGTIHPNGTFSGQWTGQNYPPSPNFVNIYVKTSGHISGSALTVHGSGLYRYNADPTSTDPQKNYWQRCEWSATFHPTRS